MKKMLLYCIALATVIIITAIFVVFADDSDIVNTEFLSGYGWVVASQSVERVTLTLPSVPDDVYANYNRLQAEAGLDLSPYYGKNVTRFTYIVLNYPSDCNEEVRANVLVCNGKPIAGDIMTVAHDGFMHSLNFPQ